MTTITKCTPRYVDVSCPPYSVTATMTPAQQRAGIQQAWDDVSALGGGVVVLPDMYTVDRSPGSFFCLRARDNVATWGIDQFSSGLRMADGAAGSVMLVATGPVNLPGGTVNVSFARLTLDGNKAGTGPDPQRHCLWLQEAVNVLCDQVRFLNAPGDGVYHHNDTRETTFRDCLFVGSGRNGLTMTRNNSNVKISRCRFRAISVQHIDSEPGQAVVPFDILVEGCTFERAVGESDFVVSVAGHSGDDEDRTHNWRFIGNRFGGSVNVTWARDIVFSGNEWVISDETYAKPCLFLNRTTEHVAVTGNTFESTVHCIEFQATSGVGQQPRHVTIDGNTFVLLQRTGSSDMRFGVNAAAGPGEYVFSTNTVLGPSDGTGGALFHRSTRRNKSVSIRGNIVRQCILGFRLVSAATNRFERVVLEGNTFDPGLLTASFAVVLDRDANVIDDFVMANNIWTGVGVVPVARDGATMVPYAGSQLWRTDGSAGIQATYSCLGSPLGQFDAPIGSLAVRRDGGIATTLYVKEAVTSAGWTAK
ncbi:MAG: right-handed parallel beta-helix repeat-containing protein [Actinomycetota bacterium]|nr:right-handed parallel beta-helix repeat-containing protein [Actinomycetota bacterium]